MEYLMFASFLSVCLIELLIPEIDLFLKRFRFRDARPDCFFPVNIMSSFDIYRYYSALRNPFSVHPSSYFDFSTVIVD